MMVGIGQSSKLAVDGNQRVLMNTHNCRSVMQFTVYISQRHDAGEERTESSRLPFRSVTVFSDSLLQLAVGTPASKSCKRAQGVQRHCTDAQRHRVSVAGYSIDTRRTIKLDLRHYVRYGSPSEQRETSCR